MAETILELRGISKRFGGTVAVRDLSLAVSTGEFFTFLGPSGSGKSTVLRMIAGLERPDAGAILIDGRDMAAVEPWHRNLGMMFQHYALFPHMTVAENVAYGLKVRRLPARATRERVARMVELVGLAGMEERNATLLSGGEQQRVALARALAPEPRMLLLDEPLSALDEKIRRAMQAELKHVQRRIGTTFLYVTHDQEEALTMSDRIVVFDRGAAVQCDEPERLYQRPRTRFVAGFFRGCNIVRAERLAAENGQLRVRLGGTDMTLEGAAARNAPLHLAIRAENLHLIPPAPPGAAALHARVREVTYRGTVLDYTLELADGQMLTATTTRRVPATADDRIVMHVAPADVVPLED
jgi:ABC-type Fe3+/spermidine/putrescine transport system ATPase subunit